MTYDEICNAVAHVQKVHDESDPFRLCRDMGIIVLYQSLGREQDAIKGFFLKNKRIKTITINCDLPLVIQRIICAHEIGHAVLHKDSGISAFHEVGMFDESSAFEKDANLFAAEYLLHDDDVLETLNADNTFFSSVAQLRVPVELLDFKFRIMKWRGYKLVEPPISARSNFLLDMEVPKNPDYDT